MTLTITQSEAARRLGVCRRTVVNAIDDGRLQTVTRGGVRRVLLSSLDGFERLKPPGRPRRRWPKPREMRAGTLRVSAQVVADGSRLVYMHNRRNDGHVLDSKQARALSYWLIRFAEWCEQQNERCNK